MKEKVFPTYIHSREWEKKNKKGFWKKIKRAKFKGDYTHTIV